MNEYQNDIERYLRGEMSHAEMNAFEKKALSDPFLSDALDGAAMIGPSEFASDVAALRGNIHSRKGRTVSLWAWTARIAAAVAFIAVVSILVYRFADSGESRLAMVEESSNAVPETTPNVILSDSAAMEDREMPTERRKAKDDAAGRSPFRLEGHANKDHAAIPAPESLAEAEPLVVHEDLIIPQPVAPSVAKAEAARNYRHVVTGTVLDSEDGKGLPGVNVTIRGTNIGTVTDEEGRYQIRMDSLGSGLLFSFIGFESQEVLPTNTMEMDVTLSPDISQLSEVVVVGYSPAKEPEEMPVIEMAAPSGGRKAFKQYLEQSLRYPEQALNNKIEGKVTIQFTIESNGKTGDFIVLKGIGYGCDEEVIRLIKEGPAWVPTRRNKEPVRDKVKVRLRFSLPKKQ